ncbi:ATPase [Terrihabitans soli]|uniref:Chemotaxis protein CheA n=1 Tax=Terrihabitans soli TaxID=708113 RepID=A0A6S6QSR8_9HYPH|nr:chemotaxis protein CheW [Terrihabitans soli]BCJ89970.1 ATPase [Terrihabitans soli]
MDDLLREFLTETNESLDVVDIELVKFEQDPNNAKILDNIFRLVHTIKGTCGFLGLPRLEAIAHASETLMGKFRDGAAVNTEAVSLVLTSIDRIKSLLAELERTEAEPEGEDRDIISQLEAMSQGVGTASAVHAPAHAAPPPAPPAPKAEDKPIIVQTLERDLRPGEVSLDDLEKAFRETAPEETPVKAAAPAPAAPSEKEVRIGEVSEEELERAFREADGPELGPVKYEREAAPAPAAAAPAAPAPAAPAAEKPAAKKPEPKKPAAAAAADDEGGGKLENSIASQSIRVGVDTLEHLMTMVSELVLTRNQLLEIVRHHEESEFKTPLQRLSNVTAELQDGVMKTRMQPIGNAWQKLPRVVRDLAQELGKKIELDMHGAETELDRQILDIIKDPLTHMVRNSADHGLEPTEDRKMLGKPEKGTIRLSAFHEGGHIIIQIADDGRGLNVDRIKKKALENGLATESELERMNESQIQKFIFHPGFSTAAAVTSVSGRGVGMDVVKTNIDLIGGTIDLKSVVGEGTTFTIKIPLTLAIVPALIVEVAGDRFAIPQIAVIELVRANAQSEHQIEHIKDTPVLRLRNKLLPLIHLRKLLGLADADNVETGNGFIVVTQVGPQTFGIVVDGVFHTEEIVVKPMSSRLRHITMFSGTTILGDGSVIMIIDPNGIAHAVGSDVTAAAFKSAESEEHKGPTTNQLVSMLVFRSGGQELKAVPLSLVTRLEEIDVKKIEVSNGRNLVQYRGSLMPLIEVTEETKIREDGAQPLLVFSEDGRSMGLIVDEIVDIVEDQLNIEVASTQQGILGSAVVKGQATEIIDIAHYLPLAFDDWLIRKEQNKTGPARPRHLLFVDDSAFFRNMLLPVLRATGYEVTAVGSGPEALNLMKAGQTFDVVVSDIEMPEMSGFDLAEAVRADSRHANVPIIALSSLTTADALERGRKAGFDDYVAKFDRPGLIAALKENTAQMEHAA